MKISSIGNKANGQMSKRVFQENKARPIFRKRNISYTLIRARTCRYQGVRNVRFFGKFDMLCFLETAVLRFALLPNYQLVSFFFNNQPSNMFKSVPEENVNIQAMEIYVQSPFDVYVCHGVMLFLFALDTVNFGSSNLTTE